MFLATSILTNWIFWVVVVAVLAIIAVIVINIVIDSKIKKIEKQDIAQKENSLRDKLYPSENEKKAEPVQEEKVEEKTEPVQEEKAEEKAEPVQEEKVEEKAEPVQEEKVEEKAEPVQEEKAEEKAEPVQEEKVEEKAEPVQEEKAEEKAEPVQEEKVEEKAEPVKKEKPVKTTAKKTTAKKASVKKEEKTEPVQEEKFEQNAEDLLKDIPDSAEVEKELEEQQVQEEKEQAQEEVKKEDKKAEVKETKKENVKSSEKVVPVKEVKPTKQYNGKWMLIPEKDGYYFGKLLANNGEMLLQTERYKGISGLKSGIETIKKNIAKDNFEITVDKNKTYNFKLFASNQGLLCIGEGYNTRETVLSAIQSVKNFSNSATVISEEPEQIEEKKFSISEEDKNANGKWVIFEVADGYSYAELRANNGQVLFVTEQHKGINSLRAGLDSVRKNITSGNFAMRKDKNDNFNFKLFSENKRLLGIGAGYTTEKSCESAILSVMKFCDSVVVFNNAEEVEE